MAQSRSRKPPAVAEEPAPTPPAATIPASNRSLHHVANTFSAFRIPAYRFLWLSMICSFLGMQMQMFARGLLAYQIGGTNAAIGVVSLGWAIPQLLFALVGGTVADRFERRKLMIISQAGTALVATALSIMVSTGHVDIITLFVAGLIQGTIFSFSGPARQAFIPEVVGEQELMKAIALNNAGMNLTRIGGPSLAAAFVAVSWIDVGGIYALQAALNVISLTLLFFLPLVSKGGMRAADRERALTGETKPAPARPSRDRASMRADLVEGLRYIFGSPILLTLLMMGLVPSLLAMSYQSYLPVFAKSVFGDGVGRNAGALGFMGTMAGVGSLCGSLAVATMSDYPRRTQLQLAAGLGFGLSLAFFAVQNNFAAAIVGLVSLGFMSSFFQSLNATMVMTASDSRYYGRVMSVNMMTFSLMPLGTLPIGFIADAIGHVGLGPLSLAGIQATQMGAGLIVAAFILAVTVFNPSYRRLGQNDLKRFASVAVDRMKDARATEASGRGPQPFAGDAAEAVAAPAKADR